MGELVRLDVDGGIGTIVLDRPPMNALSRQLQEELRAAADEVTDRTDVRAVVVYGGPKVFAAGADVKEMAGWSYADIVQVGARLQSSFTAVAADAQADRGGRHRLRARRRPRAGAVLRLPGRRRQRQARPAGDPARADPRCRRHAAAAPAGRARPREGHRLQRSLRRCRGGAGDRAGRPGRRRRTTCTPRRERSSSGTWTGRRYALRAAKEAHRPRPVGRPRHRSRASNGSCSRRCSRPRTAQTGLASFVENGPGQAKFVGR